MFFFFPGQAFTGYLQGKRQAIEDNWTDMKNYNQAQKGQLENLFSLETFDPRVRSVHYQADQDQALSNDATLANQLRRLAFPGAGRVIEGRNKVMTDAAARAQAQAQYDANQAALDASKVQAGSLARAYGTPVEGLVTGGAAPLMNNQNLSPFEGVGTSLIPDTAIPAPTGPQVPNLSGSVSDVFGLPTGPAISTMPGVGNMDLLHLYSRGMH